ncbi:MAG: hypothetical protein ABDI07_11740, partial [Candidatus Kryptonium sp.]
MKGIFWFRLILISLLIFLTKEEVMAHRIDYQVKEERAICVSFYYKSNDPMSFADVEIFSPRGNGSFQRGKSDRNGLFCFIPDEPGIWRITAKGMAEHGPHGAKVDIKVNEARSLE